MTKRGSSQRPGCGRRRAHVFGVTRWLQLGAVSAGISAALLVAPGAATADSGGGFSGGTRAASSSSDTGSVTSSTQEATRLQQRVGRAVKSGVASGTDTQSHSGASAVLRSAMAAVTASRQATESRSTNSAQIVADVASRRSAPQRPASSVAQTPPALGVESATVAAVATSSVGGVQAVTEPYDETPSDRGYVSAQKPSLEQRIDAAVYGFLDAVSNCLSKLPANPVTEILQGAWLTVRRTFFNQAPTLNPSQTTGQLHGTITGTLGAVDPESDEMLYGVLQSPLEGTVNLNPDGTYTYTPGPDFDGRDVFIVAARDTAEPALNVLDLFGNGITEALVVVQQGAAPVVNYAFTFNQTRYVWGVQRWTPEAEIGLEWAAYNLADQVVPAETITLTFTATAQNLKGNNLASAGSPLTAATPGFFPTVVQSRIQTGSPSMTRNGQPVADGFVNVNFNKDWGYNGTVGPDQYNFESTALHELMHAYGFLANVDSAGKNGDASENWSTFDKFITNSSGTFAVDPTTYAWNKAFDPNLTGGNGGLYFYGTNEALAFGGQPVPLYTPAKWEQGSSVTHLDDAYFNNTTNPNDPRYVQLMNANDEPGPSGPSQLSSIEKGILKDLGYTMA